ncbi:MAG: uroporphyrinogen decarboxylase [Proteobacteria bacterium]|nr:uroporphyrinogen decarboxylase [Pseudomonadota bacterium]NDC24425.1 uroporphyrinogen decarboxylase [Pseudomonadota bacterium]NDD04395.1 uroporphyrinogen decarboxylase [Pseudomonadota bacterium]NDG27254.1 uroporphyrinogen decarboxylase [Pseudomonadota bacterium]
MKPLLIEHLEGKNQGRFPVWMMRQAGRYLASYRSIRQQHSFWEMVTTPSLASEVSLLPLETLPLDAVIFFSDILTLPFGLGLPIEMRESIGPFLEKPLRSISDFEVFETFDSEKHTGFVGEALRDIKRKIEPSIALLGFAGAPWTVASYLIEGRSNRHFENIKSWLYREPSQLFKALDRLTGATVDYLKMQAISGVNAVQIFDTWLCEMPRKTFVELYVPLLNQIFDELRKEGIKLIYFAKGASHVLPDFRNLRCDVLSVDSLIDLPEVDKLTGGQFSLQGNLDPILLLKADAGTVRKHTRSIVQQARWLSKPAIMNLGHGILPQTPVENAKAFVEEARALWV